MEFVTGDSGHLVEDTLDKVLTHHRAQKYTSDNIEMPICSQCMCLDWGRKLKYPEETPDSRGKYENSTHRAEVRLELWLCEANVLTTKPPKSHIIQYTTINALLLLVLWLLFLLVVVVEVQLLMSNADFFFFRNILGIN